MPLRKLSEVPVYWCCGILDDRDGERPLVHEQLVGADVMQMSRYKI